MAFREKSAWIMGAIMLLTGVFYFLISGHPGEPVQGVFSFYVAVVVVLSVVAQSVLAIALPKEARAPADERERLVIDRAGRWAGAALTALVLIAALSFTSDARDTAGNVLFHNVILAIIAAQTINYGLQIFYLRRAA